MIATQDAVRSDVAIYAGGITWVDAEYDEKLGAALRPIDQDFRGFNYGLAMNQDTRSMLSSAFFLDLLNPLPPSGNPEETAYQVGQRVQKWIRDGLPIFEPMEMEYNAALCEETFGIMKRAGTFGPENSWPKPLQGADIDFTFESPLHDAIEQQKGHKFQQAQALIGEAIALDPSCAFLPKTEVALRDALPGIGVPATWINSDAYVKEQKANQEAQQASAQRLASIEQASVAAKNIGQSGMVPQEEAAV
jgi:hypothetical protein